MFSLWTLIKAAVLCLNAVAILHEGRLLAPRTSRWLMPRARP